MPLLLYHFYYLDFFLYFRNPTPSPVPVPGGRPAITWEAYTQDTYNYLHIGNNEVKMEENRRERNNAFWREYMTYVSKTPPG